MPSSFVETIKTAAAETAYFFREREILENLRGNSTPAQVTRGLERLTDLFPPGRHMPGEALTAIVGVTGFTPAELPPEGQPDQFAEARAAAHEVLNSRLTALTCDDATVLADNLRTLSKNPAVDAKELGDLSLLMAKAAETLAGSCKNEFGQDLTNPQKGVLHNNYIDALLTARKSIDPEIYEQCRRRLDATWRAVSPESSGLSL